MNKKIIITGAKKRIGFFIAKYLLEKNYNVTLIIRNQNEELLSLKNKYRDKLTMVEKDLLDLSEKDIKKIINNENMFGFVNCASIFDKKLNSIEKEMKVLKESEIIHHDLFVKFMLYYKEMLIENKIKNNKTCFINFIDYKINAGISVEFAYSLSKIKALSTIPFLAKSMAPYIRVNSISPGFTLPTEGCIEDFNGIRECFPLGYGNDCEDLAETVLFLLNQKSITGQNIIVDAGAHLKEKEIQ